MRNKNVITNEVTLTTKETGISDETRELLIIKAMLIDTVESFHKWIEEHYSITNEISNSIFEPSNKLHNIIDKFLMQVITENMKENNFKDI